MFFKDKKKLKLEENEKENLFKKIMKKIKNKKPMK